MVVVAGKQLARGWCARDEGVALVGRRPVLQQAFITGKIRLRALEFWEQNSTIRTDGNET